MPRSRNEQAHYLSRIFDFHDWVGGLQAASGWLVHTSLGLCVLASGWFTQILLALFVLCYSQWVACA